MVKRILAMSLALLLVSCSAPVDPAEDTTAADTTAEITAEETTAAPEYTAPGVKYDGRKITIASFHYDGGYPILDYHVALHEENGDPMNDAVVKRNRAVEEELGVVIDILALEKNDRNNTTKIRTQIQSQSAAFDFALQMSQGIASLITSENLLVDLNAIDTLDLSHSWWNQRGNAMYDFYGKQYAAIGDLSLINMGSNTVIFFNKELIKDNNMEDPYKLVNDGKWTLDKLIEMATKAAKDVNGDGKRDEKGDVFGFAGQSDTLRLFMCCADQPIAKKNSKGEFEICINTEKTVDIANKIVPFLNNKTVCVVETLLDNKYNSAYIDLFIPKLMQNELLFYSNQLLVALNLREMESDFGILPTPKYDESQESYLSNLAGAFSDHLIVPTTTTELDMIGHVVESMGYYSQQYVKPQFIDSTVRYRSIRDEESAKIIEMIFDNTVQDIGYFFNWGGVRTILSDMVKTNSTDFSSTWAGVKDKTESEMKQSIALLTGK